MFEGDLAVVLIAITGAVFFGAIGYVLVDVFQSGERRAAKRMKNLAAGKRGASRSRMEEIANQRRRSVQDSLKELEEKQKKQNSVTLKTRLERAGISWSVRTFWIVSFAFGVVVALFVLSSGVAPWVSALAFLAATFGFPRWVLIILRNRRQAAFLNEFATSLDIIVRGVKAGLPINDCLGMIAREAREPVRGEFRLLVESQRVGIPIDQGLQTMYERMPIPEVNFFAIVLAIQKQSGGNLAEVLGNLSKVLRDRKKMKAKIKALSQEAKSSAAIIGSLPPFVMSITYFTSPDYISLLWTEPMGHFMLLISAVWMSLGIFVMWRMMDFEI